MLPVQHFDTVFTIFEKRFLEFLTVFLLEKMLKLLIYRSCGRPAGWILASLQTTSPLVGYLQPAKQLVGWGQATNQVLDWLHANSIPLVGWLQATKQLVGWLVASNQPAG